MTLWVLADAHGGADRNADEMLVALLDAAAKTRANLLLLGDLFSAWLGPDRFHGRFERHVIDQLRGLRRLGCRVSFVVGNRDYLVREGQLGGAFDEVHDSEAIVDLGGIPTLVAHGDRTNPGDRRYLLWRGVSRHAFVTRALLATPAPLARGLTVLVESILRHSRRRYRRGDIPLPALEAYARHAASLGARRVLLGHFHAYGRILVENAPPIILAPSWLDEQRVLELEPSGELGAIAPLA